ncbi:hypothetical protein [Streptomyces yaizuensis]|uniref:Uncharacterized protein n=1 Tax=Streptomyces yaizuensis TaxID=2989713 RepID=A0AA86IWS3_9ACTN|nr:hypothetical protein [Streptomyces sp. YSPA8]BDT39463.1 hypothetical protein SYYSPA8_36725 [Streptomyces sp. YSPA8]
MDASAYALTAALAFGLGVIFACGLGLGLAAAVRISRRIERAERCMTRPTPPAPRARPREPFYADEYGADPTMVRPRAPHQPAPAETPHA